MAIYICFTLTSRFSLFTITGLDSSYVQNWLENKLASWFAFILRQWFPCQICSVWKIWPRAGFVYYLLLQAKASSMCWPKPLTYIGNDILLPGNRNIGITMHLVLSVEECGGRFVPDSQEPSFIECENSCWMQGDRSMWPPDGFLLPFLPSTVWGMCWAGSKRAFC